MDIKWFVYYFEYKQYFIFEIAQQEIQTYRDMPKHSKFSTPFLFYEMNRDKYPNLSVLATKYLVIQATSVASERVFSTSGFIVSAEVMYWHRPIWRGGRGGGRPPRPYSFGQKLRNIRAMFGFLHQAKYSFQVKISIYYI